MVAVPARTPVTSPLPASTVATGVVLLLQPPPGGPEYSMVVCPSHTWGVPTIGDGSGSTMMSLTAIQPVPSV